jgi:hypothetical protein
LPSSIALIVETQMFEFRINLGQIRGKINEHIDYSLDFLLYLALGIAEITTKMPNDKQKQTNNKQEQTLLVLSTGIDIKSVFRDSQDGKYVFELDASALVKFGIGSESGVFGYRLQFNARGELELIKHGDITVKIKPQASASVTNDLTSLFAGVDAFLYMGPDIKAESSGIYIKPIVLYAGISGTLLSSTYDSSTYNARFGAAYNTQLGSGILTLQGQYDLGRRGWLLVARYSTGDFAGQFSYDLNERKFQLGIEVKF